MEIEQTATYGKQIDDLLQKEKVARLNNDNPESVKILKNIVQIAFDLKEYEQLFELMLLLAKRRGQSKKAQIQMVELCMEFVKKVDDLPTKVKLIETIKEVCDKKIYLEVEYARCCLLLVKHKEDDNQIEQAAAILQEVQVETYGSMDRREKLEFILYQMKIMIKKQDYVRLFIISKKINIANLDQKDILDLKLTYYAYLIEYYNHENEYFEVAKCYQNIFKTLDDSEVEQDKLPKFIEYTNQKGLNVDYKNVIENYIGYLVISTYNSEIEKIFNDLKQNYQHKLEKYPYLKHLIEQILLGELISTNTDSYNLNNLGLFLPQTEFYEEHKKSFRKQLVQKNIRIIQQYYSTITLDRMAELFNIGLEETELELCEMINEKIVRCKIDRLDRTVNFKLKQNENQLITQWSKDTEKILDLIDSTCNLIKQQEEQNSKKK